MSSRSAKQLARAAAISAAFCVYGVTAQQAMHQGGGGLQPRQTYLTAMPAPSPAVTAHAVFPDHPDGKIAIGESRVTVLLGFRNNGDVPLNISFISGSLNDVNMFSTYVQNLTALAYGEVVPAGGEMTLPYVMMLAPNLPPAPFTVALSAFYFDEKSGQNFASTFFNDTIVFYEAGSIVDTQLLGMLATILLVAAAIFAAVAAPGSAAAAAAKYLGAGAGKKGVSSAPRAAKAAKAAEDGSDADEWLQGTAWTAKKKAVPVKKVVEKKAKKPEPPPPPPQAKAAPATAKAAPAKPQAAKKGGKK